MPTLRERIARGLVVRNLVLLQPLDLVIGVLVLLFFVASALVNGGDLLDSLQGALLIMVVMFTVGAAIEVIIESLRNIQGLGTAVGFITNGPEALCLIVGLLTGDIIFAASTPLGSNFMNPVMLLAAAVTAGALGAIFRNHAVMTALTLGLTAILAGVFFALPAAWYWLWIIVVLVTSIALFKRRPDDPGDTGGDAASVPRWAALPATLLLVAAGYWLDPVVSLTAEASHAPKGLIGFFVLAALTSWPEFRSCLSLLRRGRTTSAVLNITVSNVTNLWLAIFGVTVHLMVR